MKQKRRILAIGLCMALITFYGCASGGANYKRCKTVSVDNSADEKDIVFIDTKSCKKVALSSIRVYQDGDDTIVKGDI